MAFVYGLTGCDWHKEIEKGCESSRIVIPLLTRRWKTSEWTRFETYGAEAVIPLRHYQGELVNLTVGEAPDWQRFFEAVKRILSEPAPEKTARIAHLRYRANPYFVGREAELNWIHEQEIPG